MTDASKAGRAALPVELNREQRLHLQQVETLTGWRRTKIYEKVAAGELPQPERDGPRCSRWRAGAVLDALDAMRKAQSVESVPTTPAKRGPGRPRAVALTAAA